MAGTASLVISGSVTGTPVGSVAIGPHTISNTSSGDAVTAQTLSSGFNTVTVPPGLTVKGVLIAKPSGNTVTLTLKGVTGDTGIPLHLTDPDYLSLASGTTAIGITTNGTVVLTFKWI